VESLSGTIEMESTFGQGSTFRVLLPPNGPNVDQYLIHGDSQGRIPGPQLIKEQQ